MSFESDVHHPGDEFTSPDLALLAEQLSQDAAMLAGKYPARPLRQPRDTSSRRWPPWLSAVLRGSAAAAALIVVSIGCWTWWSHSAAFRPELTQRPMEGHKSQPASPHATVESTRTTPPEAVPPEIMPVVLFHNLSGAEKEAVLDLFENSTSADARLSI